MNSRWITVKQNHPNFTNFYVFFHDISLIFSGISDPTTKTTGVNWTVCLLVGALPGNADANESWLKHLLRMCRITRKVRREILPTKNSVKTMYSRFYGTNGRLNSSNAGKVRTDPKFPGILILCIKLNGVPTPTLYAHWRLVTSFNNRDLRSAYVNSIATLDNVVLLDHQGLTSTMHQGSIFNILTLHSGIDLE